MEHGIFIRGTLIGTKDDSYRTKDGQNRPFKALGINVPITNSFGFKSSITKEIRISEQKQNDAAFMKSLADNYQNDVELEISIGDYKQLYVPQSSVLTVLNSQPLKQVG
jgi:hypothetical protein